jgi:Cu+-exporting ATPase
MPTTFANGELLCSGLATGSEAVIQSGQAPRRTGPSNGQPASVPCFHCGTVCPDGHHALGEKSFCCQGCLTVFELLTENGLSEFYEFGGVTRFKGGSPDSQFNFLDEPAVREKLVDYADEELTRITLQIPGIHCIACVWLLENLYRLKPGLGASQVNFPKKELAVAFKSKQVRLSEVIALLASLGYEPELRLSDLQPRTANKVTRRLWLQLGVAGFAFGNTMLFSIASYLGLDSASGPGFQKLVGLISLLLGIPVVIYCASDYWSSAWVSLRRRTLNIEVPIAAGIAALFGQSAWEVLAGRGVGYFDSLAGLIFFLLCGRLFQNKTFDRLTFDRDFRAFFPLSVLRQLDGHQERVSLSQLQPGDELVIRNGELIPADSRLCQGQAVIDYSFVTGESQPLEKRPCDYVYAGGRQMGPAIHVQMLKQVSQGYLTSLWNQDAFQKNARADSLKSVTNRYAQRFTKLVFVLALGAALYWAWTEPTRSIRAFISVLIVACPCALALAAPFALGTAQRILARKQVFLKNPGVIESLAAADAVVFDKTGTLTTRTGRVAFHGRPLSVPEASWLSALTRHSTHPQAARILEALGNRQAAKQVVGFQEFAGCGMQADVCGHLIWMGSASWLQSKGVPFDLDQVTSTQASDLAAPFAKPTGASTVHVALDRAYRGCFELGSVLRANTAALLRTLPADFEVSLLSGDTDHERARLAELFGSGAQLCFRQSPLDKLEFIRRLQESGRRVIMVGDGLNDAGALRQSEVGVAVVEEISAFSPASDVILSAQRVPQLALVVHFSKDVVRVVRYSFIISALYNAIGISIAARGLLSPVICAVLMPLSSVTVVALACGLTTLAGRRRLEPQL